MKVVHLKVIKSSSKHRDVSYDKHGNLQNKVDIIKIVYNTKEWKHFIANHNSHNFITISVEKVMEFDGKNWKDIETPKEIEDVVKKSLVREKEVDLTPDQARIAELERKLELLTGSIDEDDDRPKRGRKPKQENETEK